MSVQVLSTKRCIQNISKNDHLYLDWSTLRKTHKIVGTLIGCCGYNTIPRLPLKLMPEEVLHLLDLNVATLVQYDFGVTLEGEKEKFEQLKEDILIEQNEIYKAQRRTQLEGIKDKIIEGKRRKGDTSSADKILDEILEESCKVTEENMMWPVLSKPLVQYPSAAVSRGIIEKKTTSLKYAVCRDLWAQGYYITSGFKFGGQFLAYEGDPVLYHSVFIVHCLDNNQPIAARDVLVYGRLANTVRKTAILASYDDENKVTFKSLEWLC